MFIFLSNISNRENCRMGGNNNFVKNNKRDPITAIDIYISPGSLSEVISLPSSKVTGHVCSGVLRE